MNNIRIKHNLIDFLWLCSILLNLTQTEPEMNWRERERWGKYSKLLCFLCACVRLTVRIRRHAGYFMYANFFSILERLLKSSLLQNTHPTARSPKAKPDGKCQNACICMKCTNTKYYSKRNNISHSTQSRLNPYTVDSAFNNFNIFLFLFPFLLIKNIHCDAFP